MPAKKSLGGFFPPWNKKSERRLIFTGDLTAKSLQVVWKIWQKRALTSGNMVSEFPGSSENRIRAHVQGLAAEVPKPGACRPHDGCRSPTVTLLSPHHKAGATLVCHFPQRTDTWLCICQAWIFLECPPNIFNFQNYRNTLLKENCNFTPIDSPIYFLSSTFAFIFIHSSPPLLSH